MQQNNFVHKKPLALEDFVDKNFGARRLCFFYVLGIQTPKDLAE